MPNQVPNPAIEIVPARADDASRIAKLILPLVETFISYEFSEQGQQMMSQAMSESAIRQNLQGDYRYTLAMDTRNTTPTVAGVLGIKRKQHIFHFFVAEAYHRQGVAKALWQEFISQSGEIFFSVNSSRFAVGFYQALGFQNDEAGFEKNGIVCYPMTFKQKTSKSV